MWTFFLECLSLILTSPVHSHLFFPSLIPSTQKVLSQYLLDRINDGQSFSSTFTKVLYFYFHQSFAQGSSQKIKKIITERRMTEENSLWTREARHGEENTDGD